MMSVMGQVRICNRWIQLHQDVVGDRDFSREELDEMASSREVEDRLAAALSDIRSWVLDDLAEDDEPLVRFAVALNGRSARNTMKRLREDDARDVRRAAKVGLNLWYPGEVDHEMVGEYPDARCTCGSALWETTALRHVVCAATSKVVGAASG